MSNTADINNKLRSLIAKYADSQFKNITKGLSSAADILIDELKQSSPRGQGNYAESWQKIEYKNAVYVGNKKTVKGKNGEKIPLINILEFSDVRANKHVDAAFDKCSEHMIQAFLNKMEEGSGD